MLTHTCVVYLTVVPRMLRKVGTQDNTERQPIGQKLMRWDTLLRVLLEHTHLNLNCVCVFLIMQYTHTHVRIYSYIEIYT